MNTLQSKQVADTLAHLHGEASADSLIRRQKRQQAAEKGEVFDHSWSTAYMAIDSDQGQFFYFLATLQKARNIVEFGCSFGISTIYLAAAARDNGGRVITTDMEPNKVLGARKNLEDAGLSDIVEVLQGDALQTLSAVKSPIDFLLLDGAKELYLPVFEMLRPKLSPNAIIIADNTDKPETRPLVDYILLRTDEFTAVHLFENRTLIAYMK